MSSGLRFVIDGENISPLDIQGDQQITTTITVEGEDNETLKKAMTGTLTFYGRAWEILNARLIEPVGGALAEVPYQIYNTCATPEILIFDGVFQGSAIEWCEGNCFCTVTGIEHTKEAAAMDCIMSTMIYDNTTGFQQRAHPRMVYLDEIRPEWLAHVALITGISVIGVYDSFTLLFYMVMTIINTVNVVLNFLGMDEIDLDGDGETSNMNFWSDLRARLLDKLIGYGRKHPSPYLRNYILNVCEKCQIGFQSSILNDPSSEYYDTVLWSAPVEKGTRDESITYIEKNRPIMSGKTLLDNLKPVYNASYTLREIGGNTTLVFERKDKVFTNPVWIDPAQLEAEGRLIGKVCYSWSEKQPYAFGILGFSEDGMDEPGNESRDFYKGVFEWNIPFNPAQRGEKLVAFQYGMNRNRNDGITPDVVGFYRWLGVIRDLIDSTDKAMLVSRGIASLPKLLVHDGDMAVGHVKSGYDRNTLNNPTFKPPGECYNFPYWMTEYGCAPNTAYDSNEPELNLYGRFHAIDNPKVLGTRRIDFKFEFEFNANDLRTMDPRSKVPLQVAGGLSGRITSITINHTKGTIQILGKA